MERSTQIWVGVAILGALAGGVYKVSRDDAKKGTTTTTSAEIPELKVGDDIDKISITNADKGDVVLEKKGSGPDAKWELTKPLQAPANQNNVKQLLDNLKELKGKEVIASTASDEQKKDFQFEKDKAVHVVAFHGSDKKLDASFGKSGGRGQMAMLDGKPGIYTVAGYSSYVYAREVKGWRDTEVFKFDDANVIQVAIENKNGSFSFTKGGDTWGGTFKDKPIAGFDPEKVKDGLRNLKSLNAENFGDGKSPAETGLDHPEAKVTVTLKDGAGKYTLRIGKTSSGTSHYAEKEGDPTIFVLPTYATEFALTEPSKLMKPKDAGADSGSKDAPPHGGPHGMPGMPPGVPGGPEEQ